ncbi:MAG TPA: metallophosphoesterase [Dermatophilaceae bacterium]|nr:metallophosphoesterase [Dermatophilaceae bacterium]
MSASQTWWFVGDLHLDTRPEPRGTGAAFAAFVHELAGSQHTARHLVLLGDTFELVRHREAAARLREIAVAHADAFAALRAAVRHGVHVHFVCGNHDAALARPDVAGVLLSLLGHPSQGVAVHAWALAAPGAFYCEHGHQHHEVHRVATLLSQQESLWAEWLADRSGGVGRRAMSFLRATAGVPRRERAARSPAYLARLDEEALRIGLTAQAVRDLAQTSAVKVAPALARVGWRVLSRRVSASRPYGLRPAAARVHRILRRHGSGVPTVLFAHTHRAEDTSLAQATGRYVNVGTWSADVRGAGPDGADPDLFPYARIVMRTGEAATATLRYWRRIPAHRTVARHPA